VIAVIFSSFEIPQKYQHRVLFWGILGAIIFRGLMILFGVALINSVSWMIYVFGAFLLYTAYKMYQSKDEEFDPRSSFAFRFIRNMIPITREIHGEQFFVRRKHIRAATPLFVALLVIEVTDVLFALDSIPAVLAITSDPFLVYTSNIMAILGLRSMYFFVSHMLAKFKYIDYSLIAILTFVGLKMMISHFVYIPLWFSLAFIVLSILFGIYMSTRAKSEI
jgi:tellurite resistance protein TerC